VIPLFLSVYVGLLLGLVAWGYVRVRRLESGDVLAVPCDDTLLALVVLAVFTTGVFPAYVVLDLGL